jgi:cob(I)alamin adenosyltransferase
MSIVTKTGDQGETGLFGGRRLPKDDLHLQAIGGLDELNAAIGVLLSFGGLAESVRAELLAIQEACFVIGGELATPDDAPERSQAYIPRLKEEDDLTRLEDWLKEREAVLSPQTKFILPNGCKEAALAFWIRAVVRRAERAAVAFNRQQAVNPVILRYVNRLSDYFFILGRFLNQEANQEETEWQGGGK